MNSRKYNNIYAVLIISQLWDDTNYWNFPLWDTRTSISCIANTMAADDILISLIKVWISSAIWSAVEILPYSQLLTLWAHDTRQTLLTAWALCWWSQTDLTNDAVMGMNDYTRTGNSHHLQTTGWYLRVDSRLAPSQWETSLQSNAVSHWLGANLESALYLNMMRSWHGNALRITGPLLAWSPLKGTTSNAEHKFVSDTH